MQNIKNRQQQLNLMKEFWPPGGGARPWRPPLDPPLKLYMKMKESGPAAHP